MSTDPWLRKADDYRISGVWEVCVGDERIGTVRPVYAGLRTKRWSGYLGTTQILGGLGARHGTWKTRERAAVQVLAAWQRQTSS